MKKYIDNGNGSVTLIDSGAVIPYGGGWMWTEYLDYIAAGGEVIPQKPSDNHILVNEEWVLDTEKIITNKINNIKNSFINEADLPVELTINNTTYTFNGGLDSSLKIFGALELAKSLKESTCDIWDINNIIHTFSLEETEFIASSIGKIWRELAYKKQKEVVSTLQSGV